MALDFSVPAEFHGLLRLGTCSWKYDSWKGLVYEKGRRYRPGDYLADYAKVLDSVEVDQWFWSLFPGHVRLPDPRDVRLYEKSVPNEGSAPLSIGRFLDALAGRKIEGQPL
jgi:hypothetical protein